MKHLSAILMTIFFSNLLNAQPSENYKVLWDKVAQYEKDGLPKSALKIVESIQNQAQKDKNHPQEIKTMLYKGKFALVLEDDAQLNIINDFKKQIAISSFPTKNILESLLANLYWQYFNQNRWQFYNRTKTSEKVDANDFRTWDLQTLFNEIHFHYQNSLQNGLMLQQENLEKYNVLLNEKDGSKIYRPTLFDFLNHTALEFYKTNETQITKPAFKFEINNPDFLTDAKSYSVLKISSKDTTSLQLNALHIYKNLIKFHLKSPSPFALEDVNIERLKFVNQHATFPNKETLLLEVLKAESNRLKNHKASALYHFEIASIYFQQSQQYNQTNTKHRWKAKEAMAICKSVISEFPKSKGAEKCQVLKSQIEQESLQIITEEFIPIQQNSRLLVNYKNLENLQFHIYKLSTNQLEKFNKTYRKEEQLSFIKTLNVTDTWNSNLRNEEDYQTHSTEILIPKLNNGRYLIVASLKNDDTTFAFANIQITNMALVEMETPDYKIFQIVDRNNGDPITNTTIELSYIQNYNQNIKTENYNTNNLGQIKIKKSNDRYRNINLKIINENDIAYFGDYYINQKYNQKQENINYTSFLFTDRSIYRPGQTVYFKGIAIKTEEGKSKTLANQNVYIALYNVNDEEIKKIKLKTNEFGSISGEFILPNNGLNGKYRIEFDADSGNIDMKSMTYFSVEEYKRPKFETKFPPITETFKINDSISVKGMAIAYAGNNITDAKVVYRVHRKVQYPHWYFWYRPWFNSEPQEITHGETITNNKGEFEITFKALPDTSIDKNNLPVFNYEITADITDLNGETRSATTIVNVGYHALIANMSIENTIDKTKKNHTINIDTRNLNGQFVSAKGVVKIYKLKAPNTVLRPRPWNAPDYQNFNEKAFKNLFPHDAYNNEDNPDNWKKGTLVFEETFDTKTSNTLKLGNIKKWESGKYLITLESKDKFEQLVKDEIKITLFSDNDKTIADKQLFSITTNKSTYNIGDTAYVTLVSAVENLNVTVSVEKNKQIIQTEIIHLNTNKKTISIPVTKDDLGGFVVHYSFATFNSFQSGSQPIPVPYPNTNLEIETLTFRDKLQPGNNETWSFKIKGPSGEKISTELLASMYDASLDQFKSHSWNFNPIQNLSYYAQSHSNANQSFGTRNFSVNINRTPPNYPQQVYDQLNWFGFYFGYKNMLYLRKSKGRTANIQITENELIEEVSFIKVENDAHLDNALVTNNNQPKAETETTTVNTNDINEVKNLDSIPIRKNLQETAFFFPQLKTDELGNVSFSFTSPEALTQWKLQLLAHSKTLESATKTLTTVTQKELMVTPNAPRFLREGDKISIRTKISNLTNKQLSGKAYLILTDAISGKDISNTLFNIEGSQNKYFDNSASNSLGTQDFLIDKNGNTQISWRLSIPDDVPAIQYKIIAKSGDYSDGEQNALPVLSNRMLVTETLPMWIKSNETKTFTLNKLISTRLDPTQSTLSYHKLTLEMTSNPAWYAVQALPYLMEYPYECNEQTFSRYYANALASHITNSNPRIQDVFKQWRNTDALLSNLEKNEELKSILIQETPWLRDAQNETEQKKRIALLFDLNKMNNELQLALQKLENNQMYSGGWAWFNGGRENRYITQHIVTGFGHLNKLNVTSTMLSNQNKMIQKALNYLDAEFVQEYKDIRKYNANVDLNKDHLSYRQLHYLYMRSFFPEIKKSTEVETIIEYYQTQIEKYWLSRSLYSKGLMALISHRNGAVVTASKILKSLKETSITSEELGMYWKANTNSWFWYQAPIETQALLIETFSEAGTTIQSTSKNLETIDNLKIWLLKNKQTNRWKTTKATTDAVYALLLQGSDWLSLTDMVEVVLGGQKIEPSKLENVKIEAGTGYYKTSWNPSEIKPEMGEVKITKKSNGIAWGSLYWQYFEDLDKITSAETPLTIKKKLFLKKHTDMGEEISEITESTNLKVGDLVRVRIELHSDRNMEFLHMKDMRASGFEPINVISSYKWQDGLGYYESTKDASTNFFFDYLPKGVYVFEYDLRANNAGNMSNGITTIQSMYAPEFSSHSEGVRININ
ncbi:alpha-2-macroglobulin [Pseudalgibacter alginicilyticus]|uniref:Alpha-2-macroglobulin n=1 Tax=Pseudalgibacter alginicilyticus TaxID=1736674 RepID=A0A0P0CF87_9FLAO|nr:MG2 domain-containing protein [Pseudalgibacter alginicilyticus]ALJ04795.1 alpha-2-macroglobulin [Pseudalgibacter alginicilyticus]